MKKIIELQDNYKQSVSDGKEIFGESWDSVKITDENVLSIEEHLPQGEGDRYYCDVEYKDGKIFRTFNPCGIVYQQAAK